MPIHLNGRSLLTLRDFRADEIQQMIDTAADLKAAKRGGACPRRLVGKNVAMIFLKPSCRTRAAFAVAAADEGANLEVLPPEDIRFGEKESVKDIARTLEKPMSWTKVTLMRSRRRLSTELAGGHEATANGEAYG